jgi:hypothetical protein
VGIPFRHPPIGARGGVLSVGQQHHSLSPSSPAKLLQRPDDGVVQRCASLRNHGVEVTDQGSDVIRPVDLHLGVPRKTDQHRLVTLLEELIGEAVDGTPDLGEILDHRARGVDGDGQRQGQVGGGSESLHVDLFLILEYCEVLELEPHQRRTVLVENHDWQEPTNPPPPPRV